jgi:hypothetical protein
MDVDKIIQSVAKSGTQDETVKVVSLDSFEKKSSKTVKTEKAKTKRVITESNSWTSLSKNLLDPSMHILLAHGLDNSSEGSVEHAVLHRLEQQVRLKIAGYKAQDCEKGLFLESAFVCSTDVFTLFKQSELKCYYCKEQVALLYEYVREPRQWTLERLDNSRGHNRDNVVLACLSCNLRRRCMASEKYVKTKELANIIKVG